MNTSTYGTIVEPYTPRCEAGRDALALAVSGHLRRLALATCLRSIRIAESGFAARHCLAWLDWLGAYPTKGGGR